MQKKKIILALSIHIAINHILFHAHGIKYEVCNEKKKKQHKWDWRLL